MAKICILDFCRNILFYRLSNDSLSASLISTLSSEKGMVPLDGTWRCLSILTCVGCAETFMTLRACPHVWYYLAGHLAVSHLMLPTTHLMCIKCGDLVYLWSGAARLRTMHPPRRGFGPCIPPLLGNVLTTLGFLYKFSHHINQQQK